MKLLAFFLLSLTAYAQATWTPDALPNCQVDLNPDAWGLSNGAAVNTWNSGCGTSITGTYVATAGTYVSNAINGHAGLLLASNASYSVNWSGTPLTVFAVYQDIGAYNANAALMGADSSGQTYGAYSVAPVRYTNSEAAIVYTMTGGALNAYMGSKINTMAGGNWSLWTSQLNGTAATLRLNSQQVGTASGSGTPVTVLSGSTLIGADWYSHGPADYCHCTIARLIAFSGVLTAGQVASVERYLEHKYFDAVWRNAYVYQSYITNVEQPGAAQVSANGTTWTGAVMSEYYQHENTAIQYYKGRYWKTDCGCNNQTSDCLYDGAGGVDALTWDLKVSNGGAMWAFQQAVVANPGGGGAANDRTCSNSWYVDPTGLPHVLTVVGTLGTQVNYSINENHPCLVTGTGCATADPSGLTVWSTPAAINISGIPPTCTQPCVSGVSDAYIQQYGGQFVLIYKDPNLSAVYYATASAWNGPYTYGGPAGHGFEAGSILRVGQLWLLFTNLNGVCPQYSTTTNFSTYTSAACLTVASEPGGVVGAGNPRRSSTLLPIGAAAQ